MKLLGSTHSAHCIVYADYGVTQHPDARGATINGTQVRSVRLPGFVLAFESVFGLPNERLTIRHDAGGGADPYVNGTLLAVRRVMGITGLVRGLDRLLFGTDRPT